MQISKVTNSPVLSIPDNTCKSRQQRTVKRIPPRAGRKKREERARPASLLSRNGRTEAQRRVGSVGRSTRTSEARNAADGGRRCAYSGGAAGAAGMTDAKRGNGSRPRAADSRETRSASKMTNTGARDLFGGLLVSGVAQLLTLLTYSARYAAA